MIQQAFSLLFPMLFFIFSLLSVSTANSNVYIQCSQLNFTSMTPYESNLNSLFTSLVNSASIYNFNKLQNSPQTDCVYGLFQCRGDLSSPDCKGCVDNAISRLKTTCPMSTGGEIQLEGCFLKYDNTSFFGAQEKVEVCRRCGPSIGYNLDVLNLIDGVLAHLVGGNGEYFRKGDYRSIQGVAQCVQDLSLSDCQDCLSEASGRLRSECETSIWGDMYLGKCYIRYANQGDGDLANNGNSTSNKSSGGGISVLDIANLILNIVSILSGGGVTFICYQKVNNLNSEVSRTRHIANIAKETAANAEKNAEKKSEEVALKYVKLYYPNYGCGKLACPY